jgi:hypothetical protein
LAKNWLEFERSNRDYLVIYTYTLILFLSKAKVKCDKGGAKPLFQHSSPSIIKGGGTDNPISVIPFLTSLNHHQFKGGK